MRLRTSQNPPVFFRKMDGGWMGDQAQRIHPPKPTNHLSFHPSLDNIKCSSALKKKKTTPD